MKRTMKYKRKTLRRRSRARKQRGGAIGDIAKYFSFLMAPHPDGEIADFTIPEELVERITSEPLLSEDDYDRMGRADMSCLSADGYGLSKEYIESYSSRTSPLHVIGNIASIEDMRICSKQYFEKLMNKILPFYNPSEEDYMGVDYISVDYIRQLQQILKINKTLEERNKIVEEGGYIDYKEIHAELKRLLPYIPFNTIKSIFARIFSKQSIAKIKTAEYQENYGITLAPTDIGFTIIFVKDNIRLSTATDKQRDVISAVLLENIKLLNPILDRLITEKEHIKHTLNSIYDSQTILEPLIISFLRMKIVEEKYRSMHFGEDDKIHKRGWDPSRKERFTMDETYKDKYKKTSASIYRLISVLQYYIYTTIVGPMNEILTSITSVS
jgi:hypothetical protein